MNNTKDEATRSPSKFEMAVDAFHKNSDIAWIRKSVLTERAYLLGLYDGHGVNNPLLRAFLETDYVPDNHKPFWLTRMGRSLSSLKDISYKLLGSRDNGVRQEAIEGTLKAVEEFLDNISYLNRDWERCMSASRLLHDMRSLLLSSHNQAWGEPHQNWREPFCEISVILDHLETDLREFEKSFGPIP
jgi:hypothetical protein